MKRLVKTACAILVVVGLFGSGARSAHADARLDEAKAHFQRGIALYDQNDYAGALTELQRAYELSRSYKILFDVAQVQIQLQDDAGALKTYARYVQEGGSDIPAARLTQVNLDSERLRDRVGFIAVDAPPGSEVLVDDVPVGYTPLPAPIAVSARRHELTVRPPGREPVTRMLEVTGRQEVTQAFAAALPDPHPAPASAAADPRRVPEPPPEGDGRKAPMYIAWATAGGLAVAAGALALVARNDGKELAALRGTYPVPADRLASQHSRTERNAALADVFGGAAAVSAGIALYLTIARAGASRAPGAPAERAAHVEVSPGGIAIAGRF